MSTIAFSLQVQALDFAPLDRGFIQIVFNDGIRNHTFTETVNEASLGSGYIKEIPWVGGFEDALNEAQATEVGKAFQRDYLSVGAGAVLKNITYSVENNVVTLDAKVGTFVSMVYVGNVLIVGTAAINNTPQASPLAFSVTRNPSNGDCNNIMYSAVGSGGTAPYILKDGATVIDSNWDGTTINFTLSRGLPHSLSMTDAVSDITTSTQIVPRKLEASEFNLVLSVNGEATDIAVENTTPVLGTTPFTYSLDGAAYKSSNIYTGILEGTYVLNIKDAYGCVVSKNFTLDDATQVDTTLVKNPRYFDVVDANSFIITEKNQIDALNKRNFRNTLSTDELVNMPYTIDQDFDGGDFVVTQFKSSFPYHIVTLAEYGGLKVDIPFVMIQKNLGSTEKVDCKIFETDLGELGVYFQGGNEYEPDTETVIGSSIHTTFTPEWAVVEQTVKIDGLGTVVIESTGYDPIRGGYFTVSALPIGEVDGKIQVTFNKQDYNLFEFIVPIGYISGKARLTIEKGFAFNDIDGNPWVSEWIRNNPNTQDFLLIEWSDPKNRGGMVFQSGIKGLNRIQGSLRPIFDNETKNYKGDNNTFLLDVDAYQHYEVFVEAISAKEAFKLNIASGMDGFVVNNMLLARNSNPDIEPIDGTNLYTWKCEFAYGINALGYDQDERVTNISTGVENGGSILIDVNDDGSYRITEGGKFIVVDGKYVAVP